MEPRQSYRRPLALSLVAMQILGTTSFLVPHPSSLRAMPAGYRAAHAARPTRGLAGLRMLKEPQGSDAFSRILEKDRTLSPLHKLPAASAKALKFTTIPLGAAVGFVATPLASPVLRACGALFAGVAAKVANDRVRSVSTHAQSTHFLHEIRLVAGGTIAAHVWISSLLWRNQNSYLSSHTYVLDHLTSLSYSMMQKLRSLTIYS